jgi:hypothetical protein
MSHCINGITMVIRLNSCGLSLRYNLITPLDEGRFGRQKAALAAAFH